MMTRDPGSYSLDHPLVRDYLERLRAESSRLPADQAHELYADISDHLRTALADADGEAEVRQRLDRVGSPAQLVAEASGAGADPAGTAAPQRRGLDVAAVISLLVAEVLFFASFLGAAVWVVGLVLLGVSTWWTPRLKARGFLALGTGFPVLLTFGIVGFGAVGSRTCVSTAVRADEVRTDAALECTSTGPGIWLPITLGVLLLAYLVWQALTVRKLLTSRG